MVRHHWARQLIARGIAVRLLPAAYVRLCAAQQDGCCRCRLRCWRPRWRHAPGGGEIGRAAWALQGLHRIRSLWMSHRTSRINALRGLCREFGLAVSVGEHAWGWSRSRACWPSRSHQSRR